MAAVLEKQAKRWTEYYRLDDDQRYEIIDGQLLMAPLTGQMASGLVAKALSAH